MEVVQLGATDLRVARLCLGTWQFSGAWGRVDPSDAIATVHAALDADIRFFDTAQAYGFGSAEELLARALAGRRYDVVIATKGGLRPSGARTRDAGRAWLRQGIESSLRALRTEYVDLYQVHWPDASTPAEETAETLRAFVREGKARRVGVSNYDVAQMEPLQASGALDTLQPPYHLLRRDAERELLPWCGAHDIGVLVYGPLAHGLLGGRYGAATEFPRNDWRRRSSAFTGDTFRRNLAVVDRLKSEATRIGCTLPQLAIAWTLAHPAVHCAIVGARRPDQITGVVPAASLRLDADALARIEEIVAAGVQIGGATPEGIE